MAEIYDGPDELPLHSHYGEEDLTMVGNHDNIIFYKENGDDVIQVESSLTEEGNFHIVVREEVGGFGPSPEYVYAGFLLSRSEALKLVSALTNALAEEQKPFWDGDENILAKRS